MALWYKGFERQALDYMRGFMMPNWYTGYDGQEYYSEGSGGRDDDPDNGCTCGEDGTLDIGYKCPACRERLTPSPAEQEGIYDANKYDYLHDEDMVTWSYRPRCVCNHCCEYRARLEILDRLTGIHAAVEIANTPAHRQEIARSLHDLGAEVAQWVFDTGDDGAYPLQAYDLGSDDEPRPQVYRVGIAETPDYPTHPPRRTRFRFNLPHGWNRKGTPLDTSDDPF